MTAHSAAQRILAGTSVRLVSADVMKDRMNEIHGLVASRAYELFVKRNRASGKDINDWLHAEHELIHSCCHEMKKGNRPTYSSFTLRCQGLSPPTNFKSAFSRAV